MKNLLIILFAVLSAINVNAQGYRDLVKKVEGKWTLEEDGSVSYMKVIECDSLSKEEIYDRMNSYFAYNYVDANSVIQIEDPVNGILVAKGIFPDVFTQANLVITTTDVTHIIRVDIKDNKVRVIVTLQRYKITVSSADAYGNTSSSYSNMWISQAYPVNIASYRKNYFGKLFYATFLRCQDSFKNIELSLKNGNTKLQNSDW